MNLNIDYIQENLLNIIKKLNGRILSGYRIDKLLFNSTYSCLKISHKSLIKLFIKTIFFVSSKAMVKRSNSNILMINYDYHRKDHAQAWCDFKGLFEEYSELEIIPTKISFNNLLECLNPLGVVVDNLKFLGVYIKVFKEIKSIKCRLYIALNTLQIKQIIDTLERLSFYEKVAVIFFDGSPTENTIIQHLQQQGIKTVTLQHGQPVFHGKNIDRMNQSIILNMTCDYAILPGEFSKKQYMLADINEDRLKVLGSLRNIVEPNFNNSKRFSIFLDCPAYPFAKTMNCRLLSYAERIAEIIGYKYVVKLHPQDSVVNYDNSIIKNGQLLDKGKTLNDALSNIEFAVMHASGVYLDIIASGVKCFCINDSSVSFPLVEKELDEFKDLDELLSKLQIWQNFSNDKKFTYINEVVEYYLSPSDTKQRHIDFINSLVS